VKTKIRYEFKGEIAKTLSKGIKKLTEAVLEHMGLLEGGKNLTIEIHDNLLQALMPDGSYSYPAGMYEPGDKNRYVKISIAKIQEQLLVFRQQFPQLNLGFDVLLTSFFAHELCHYVQDNKGGFPMPGEDANVIYLDDPKAYSRLPHEMEANIIGARFSGLRKSPVTLADISAYESRDPKLRGTGFLRVEG